MHHRIVFASGPDKDVELSGGSQVIGAFISGGNVKFSGG